MQRLCLAVVALLVLACLTAVPAMAVVSYSGSLTGPNGLGIAAPTDGGIHNPWDSASTVFSWDVTRTGGGWHYLYDLTVPTKNISHVLIETSLGATIDNLDGATSELAKLYQPGGPGDSNPDLPGDLFGVKFTPLTGTTDFVWAFDSVRSPVWGNFYAKDGTVGTGLDPHSNVVAWNEGFLLTNPSNPVGTFGPNLSPNLKILRPDTVSNGSPELSTWLLLACSGMAGLVLKRRRRKTA